MKHARCILVILLCLCCILGLASAENNALLPFYAQLIWPDVLPSPSQYDPCFTVTQVSSSAENSDLFAFTFAAEHLPRLETYFDLLEENPFITKETIDESTVQFTYAEHKLGAASETLLHLTFSVVLEDASSEYSLTILVSRETVRYNRYSPCRVCNQQGVIDCTHCQGSGSTLCTHCKGSGLTSVGGKRSACYRCHGEGKTLCSACLGEASTPCTTCGGTGLIAY